MNIAYQVPAEPGIARRNAWILTVAQSLGCANAPIVISLGGLVGIGWNFGFIGATSMVADCHTPAERSKVQGANDFLVFGTVACASFSAGSLLHGSRWETINWIVLPAVALVSVPLVWRAHRPMLV